MIHENTPPVKARRAQRECTLLFAFAAPKTKNTKPFARLHLCTLLIRNPLEGESAALYRVLSASFFWTFERTCPPCGYSMHRVLLYPSACGVDISHLIGRDDKHARALCGQHWPRYLHPPNLVLVFLGPTNNPDELAVRCSSRP